MAKSNSRVPIQKTYKMYIDGKFPRTESGRYYSPEVNGVSLGNICQASRKDMRNAVVAARTAQPGWAGRSAYNRSQILYRVGEMLEGRKAQFIDELQLQGATSASAKSEVELSIDRLIYFAGWCDKYQQVFSSVNPVASSHFNFSVLEPTGVVFHFADPDRPLLGLVALIAPVIASGNTVISLASQSSPLSAITFGEVLQTSDVPAGVVNLLTGDSAELAEHVARHLDINALACDKVAPKLLEQIREFAADNVKRVNVFLEDWVELASATPYLIQDFCEVKTTWHPIEKISASGSGY